MGDSDDEYDRKRRDKFRGERGEASYRGSERVPRPREEWSEREAWARPRPREYRPRDRGYSPSMEPAPKRIRHDYYAGEGYYHYPPSYHQPSHSFQRSFLPRETASASSQQVEGQQPPMMSLKTFLATQDDNISASEAIEKYNDYKLEFQRQQLNEFFVAHKDEEWFRLKYHPEDAVKRKNEQAAALQKRLEVFLDLLNSNKIDTIAIDCSQTTGLLKLLDTVVIKLEGGNDEDLETLDKEYEEMEAKYKEQKEREVVADQKAKDANLKIDELKKDDPNPEKKEEEVEIKEEKEDGETVEHHEEKINGETEKPKDKESTDLEPTDDVKVKEETIETNKDASSSSENSSDDEEETKKDKEKEKVVEEEHEEEKKDQEDKDNEVMDEDADVIIEKKTTDNVVEITETIEVIDDVKPDKPRALHKTTSIFLRNLAPTITKQEIEDICSRYDGFLRVALADPQPERRWLRRGWVTYKRDANIKEICWNLNNIRLKECDLGAIVNRDLSRRIRPVNGIVAHKQIVRSDIKIAAKVIMHLDSKSGLWSDGTENKNGDNTFGLTSNNPVLHNITDYLIEEASAEEEELLGLESSVENQESVTVVDRDENLIKALDKIILYLRIVHSVDYYNHCEYPNEDEMPNRCGILHARGPPPASKTEMTQFIGAPIENKMANFLPEKPKEDKEKSDSKLITMAIKDVDTEVDKFVQANTRELSKDKWLCPLSGKKFKGPDFVRKHIFNKHFEKIEEVKKEVEFFNNYLKDIKRPMLAEPHVKNADNQSFGGGHPVLSGGPGYGALGGGLYGAMGGYGRPQPFYSQPAVYGQRSRGYGPRARGGIGDFGRPIIHYRDLDAPREPEEFI